jgi:predicted amidohydrolase YtcJ
MVLEIATLGAALRASDATGELGVLQPGAVGDVAVWSPRPASTFAGAVADPIEAWLRCGPTAARDTVVHGTPIVRDGRVVADTKLDGMVREHDRLARRMQRIG